MCKQTGKRYKTVPAIMNNDGEISMAAVRDVSYSDLLGREVKLDMNSKNSEGKRVLITGAGGSRLRTCKQYLSFNPAEIIC